MHLIPIPKVLELSNGCKTLRSSHALLCDPKYINEDRQLLLGLQVDIEHISGLRLEIDYSNTKTGIALKRADKTESFGQEAYQIKINSDGVVIRAISQKGFFYGLQTLKQIIENCGLCLPYLEIKDEPAMAVRGFFLDLTRGRVLKLEKIKEIIDLAASLKMNQLQLYFEHTYKFSFYSEISMGTDGISSETLKEIDDYCDDRHIELIPCIATFSHIFEALKSDSFKELCEYEDYDNEPYSWMKRQLLHTIDVSNEDSLVHIEKMIAEIGPICRSPYINICGDETYDLGKGKSKEIADQVGVTQLYLNFLNKVISLVKKQGKKAMFWGDVLVNYKEYIHTIDQDAMCLYWQYESEVPEEEVKLISHNRQGFINCSAAVGWNRFINDYQIAYDNLMEHGRLIRQYDGLGMVHTDWGDFGHINTFSASIPTLFMAANVMWSDSYELPLDTYGEMISSLYYGDFKERLVKSLIMVSEHHSFKIEYLMKWVYERYDGLSHYGSSKEHFTEYTWTDIEADRLAIDRCINQLSRQVSQVKTSRRSEINELIHMVAGISWLLKFVSVVKYYEYQQRDDVSDLVTSPNLLSCEMEEWFMIYEVYWRKQSRESELYRVREVIQQLCHYLRTEI